jgi:hypothetical protein
VVDVSTRWAATACYSSPVGVPPTRRSPGIDALSASITRAGRRWRLAGTGGRAGAPTGRQDDSTARVLRRHRLPPAGLGRSITELSDRCTAPFRRPLGEAVCGTTGSPRKHHSSDQRRHRRVPGHRDELRERGIGQRCSHELHATSGRFVGWRVWAVPQPALGFQRPASPVDQAVGGHLKLPAGGQWVPNDGHYGVWSATRECHRRRRPRTRRLVAPVAYQPRARSGRRLCPGGRSGGPPFVCCPGNPVDGCTPGSPRRGAGGWVSRCRCGCGAPSRPRAGGGS